MSWLEPPDDEEDPTLDETPDDKQLSYEIDEALAKHRPWDHYDADDKDWMDPVVEVAKRGYRQRQREEVIEQAARRLVYQREGNATRKTNRILRDINDKGAVPIAWPAPGEEMTDEAREMIRDLWALPLSVGRMRFRLGVAEVADLEQWEFENFREEEKRGEAQKRSRAGARMLVNWLREQGAQRVDALRFEANPDESA